MENRLATAPGVQYAYDSQNKRVWTATVDGSNNLGSQALNFYGVNGQLIGTYALSVIYGRVNPIADWPLSLAVYFGSKRIATISQGGVTSAYWQDQLGSNRNNASRYYPWGEDRSTPSNDQVRFATYTRDSATLLDYADQRYYGNAQGRFMTPDPSRTRLGPRNPQSWNRYAYTSGDPVNYLDPRGLMETDICDFDGNDASCDGGDGDDEEQDGDGESSSDPLECFFAGSVIASVSLHYFTGVGSTQPPVFYWGDSIYLYFHASGGTGNYTFQVFQYIEVLGTATYTNGTTIDATTPWQLDAQYPGQLDQSGEDLTFYDAPGAKLNTSSKSRSGFQTLVSTSLTFYATTIAWVSSGGVTVSCGIVYWTATVDATKTGPCMWRLSGQSTVTSVSP